MAHRQAKQQAFELFEKGFYPQDVSASLRVNIRTVQRWFKLFQADNVATSQPQKSGARSVDLDEQVSSAPKVATNGDVISPTPKEADQGYSSVEWSLIETINNSCRRLCQEDSSGLGEKLFGGDHTDFLERLTYNHLLTHASIRVKMQELLNTELVKPELNLRVIEKLSLGVCRHLQGEREASGVDESLSINRACVRVEKYGLIVSMPEGMAN
ncbi:helix-turn-helix domain-containing protein [Tolypothrix sp. VBCCA 56010]|uniref:helix-turn-helix domain-containing protein n=1 Tax=Tolypothrix sp. VBCCA 56010 TaxID=3137731 RepID=UPI003D7E19A6